MQGGRTREGPIRGRGRTGEGTALGGVTDEVIGRRAMACPGGGGVEGAHGSSGEEGDQAIMAIVVGGWWFLADLEHNHLGIFWLG